MISFEEWLELGHDALPDEVKNRLKYERGRFMREFERQGSSYRSCVKLYACAKTEVHLRFFHAERQGWHDEPHDCCARFQSAVAMPDVCDGVALHHLSRAYDDLVRRRHNREPAMLVNVRQLAQLPKSPRVRVFPSVIRLQSLDSCPCTSREVANHVGCPPDSRSFPSIGRTFIEDREFRRPLIGRRVLTGASDVQGEGEVIEGGSHVVDALADPNMPFLRYLADCFDPDSDVPLAITISPRFHEISYGSFPNRLFQHVQMMFCPVELCQDSVHAITVK